jgi:hypothetical protein
VGDVGEGLQGVEGAYLGSGFSRWLQDVQRVSAAAVSDALASVPVELGSYLGNDIIGSGDENKLSHIGNGLFFLERLAFGHPGCQPVG